MKEPRLKQLLNFLKETPNDPFILYAIATEYKTSDIEKAQKYFDKLLTEHPNYLATYYHVGHLYEDLGDTEKAMGIFKKGIELAKAQGNTLALRELQNALGNLEY